uniref:Uncharacterized protein n=1 Tax=Panagrolaimus davidi TaxID=227884 RepID=A0A914Q1E6_9BILA
MEYICKKFTLGRGNKLDLRLDSPLELPGNQWYCGLKEFSLEQKWSLTNDMITIHYQNGLKSIIKPGFYHSVNEIDKVLEEMFSVPRKKRNVVGNITGVNEDEEEQGQQVIIVDDEEDEKQSAKTVSDTKVTSEPKKKEPIITKIGFDFEKVGPDVVLTYDKDHIPEHIRKPPIIHEGGREGLTVEEENKRKLQKEMEHKQIEEDKKRKLEEKSKLNENEKVDKKEQSSNHSEIRKKDSVKSLAESFETKNHPFYEENHYHVSKKYKPDWVQTNKWEAPLKPTPAFTIPSTPVPTIPPTTQVPVTESSLPVASTQAPTTEPTPELPVSESKGISSGEPPKSAAFIWDSETESEDDKKDDEKVGVKEDELLPHQFDDKDEKDEKVAIPESRKLLPHAYDDPQEPEGIKDDEPMPFVNDDQEAEAVTFPPPTDVPTTYEPEKDVPVTDETMKEIPAIEIPTEPSTEAPTEPPTLEIPTEPPKTEDPKEEEEVSDNPEFINPFERFPLNNFILNNDIAINNPTKETHASHVCLSIKNILRPLTDETNAEIATIPINDKEKAIYSYFQTPIWFNLETTRIDFLSLEFNDFYGNPISCDNAHGHFVLVLTNHKR